MYENIKALSPHFFSLREIEGNVSLDIKLPVSWKYENIVAPYRSIKVKVQDKNDKSTLISIITVASKEGYDLVFSCAKDVILHNKEEEEKKNLYEEKIRELQLLFQNQSLDKLKEINLINEYGQQNTTGIRMVGQGDQEGSEGYTESQDEVDLGDSED